LETSIEDQIVPLTKLANKRFRGVASLDEAKEALKHDGSTNRFSRVTREINCLHLEWRLKGLKAVRAAGINSGRDLLVSDHVGFWQKRLRLYDVDRRLLGQLM
jgi:hypothetical protein